MRHKVAGYKLGRTTSHRRSLLRNMVTSLIIEERIETTVPKAKALRPTIEKMITLGKRGDLAARRQAAAYIMTDEALKKLFDTIGPRFGDRNGGYTRIVRTAWQKGDGADKAFIELLGSEKLLDEKRERRAEARAKKAEETRKAMEEAESRLFGSDIRVRPFVFISRIGAAGRVSNEPCRGGCPHPPGDAQHRERIVESARHCPDEGVRAYACIFRSRSAS
jgi:large subunit ribosomal protein L17